MDNATKAKWLRIALVVFGAIFVLVYPISLVWPSGWQWGGGYSHYFPMIVGVYAVLGVFLFIAARDPAQHASLISFTAWSSLVHGAIMLVQALGDPMERGHLLGDVPGLIVVFVVLLWLAPRRVAAPA